LSYKAATYFKIYKLLLWILRDQRAVNITVTAHANLHFKTSLKLKSDLVNRILDAALLKLPCFPKVFFLFSFAAQFGLRERKKNLGSTVCLNCAQWTFHHYPCKYVGTFFCSGDRSLSSF